MKHRCIENDLLTGIVFGKQSRGRQKTRLANTIHERLGMTMTEDIYELIMDLSKCLALSQKEETAKSST